MTERGRARIVAPPTPDPQLESAQGIMNATELERRLAASDQARQALLDRLSGESAEALAERATPEQWSVLEIVEHLIRAERDVFALDRPWRMESKVRGMGNRIRRVLVMAILRSPIRVGTPSKSMDPEGEKSLAELRAMWDENYVLLKERFASLDPALLDGAIFRHPVSGPITTAQALDMLDVHLERHEKQIERRLGGR